MIRQHYLEALASDPAWIVRARDLGARTYEITSFLADVRGYRPSGLTLQATATYHDSCAGLREPATRESSRLPRWARNWCELKA